MKEIREYCDLCRSEFLDKGPLEQANRTWMEIKTFKRTRLLFFNTEKRKEMEYTICQDCENKLKQWVKENTISQLR